MRIVAENLPERPQAPYPAFEIERAEAVTSPVIFASPHSGTHYPQSMQDLLSVPLTDVRRTEDAFVDDLYGDVPQNGGVLIRGLYGRAYVDLNRDARELDASMFLDGPPRTAGMPKPAVKAPPITGPAVATASGATAAVVIAAAIILRWVGAK